MIRTRVRRRHDRRMGLGEAMMDFRKSLLSISGALVLSIIFILLLCCYSYA